MPGRNIIWCQTSDASQVAAIAGQDYSHVILSALHMHDDSGTFSLYLNDTALPDVGQDYWDAVASLQAAGMTVTALLGGAGNGTWQCVTDDLQQAANVLVAAMGAPYNLQGFDLDWETSLEYSATTIGNLTNAIVAGNSAAIVTHAPVPGLLSTYDQAFWNLVGDNLAWINVQWYGDSDIALRLREFRQRSDIRSGRVIPSRGRVRRNGHAAGRRRLHAALHADEVDRGSAIEIQRLRRHSGLGIHSRRSAQRIRRSQTGTAVSRQPSAAARPAWRALMDSKIVSCGAERSSSGRPAV